MIKLSDYVFRFFEEQGVDTVFMLSGGGIMHLVESAGNSSMNYVCCHHEQSCAIAAQAYAMSRNHLGLCLVTTGPGGTNALTGAGAAYMDSTPVIFLSGQVKRADSATKRHVRQFGAQENDIVSMARPVTKYAKLIERPEDIRYELEKAVYTALSGRRGPVWLDLPLDIQGMRIEEKELRGYEKPSAQHSTEASKLKERVREVYRLLNKAERPLFLIGHGLRASGGTEDFLELNKRLDVPVVSTWRAVGVFDADSELYFGSPGLQAPRYANLAVQSCDLIIVVGSRLDNMITAFDEAHFAFHARKVVVDIDKAETDKLNMPDLTGIEADAGEFVREMLSNIHMCENRRNKRWRENLRWLKESYPLLSEKQECEEGTDLYRAVEAISRLSTREDVLVVSSTSRCNTAGHMAFLHRAGQKVISSMGFGSMGFALPSAVGASFVSGAGRIVVIEGDGSLQLNIQELQTIKHYQINARLFVFSNHGYAAIASMQRRNFDSHYVGCGPESGVSMPQLKRIAVAYGIHYVEIRGNEELKEGVKRAMEAEGPVICEIKGSLLFDEIPKCISHEDKEGRRVSAKLENPYPFLPDEEISQIFHRMLQEGGTDEQTDKTIIHI